MKLTSAEHSFLLWAREGISEKFFPGFIKEEVDVDYMINRGLISYSEHQGVTTYHETEKGKKIRASYDVVERLESAGINRDMIESWYHAVSKYKPGDYSNDTYVDELARFLDAFNDCL